MFFSSLLVLVFAAVRTYLTIGPVEQRAERFARRRWAREILLFDSEDGVASWLLNGRLPLNTNGWIRYSAMQLVYYTDSTQYLLLVVVDLLVKSIQNRNCPRETTSSTHVKRKSPGAWHVSAEPSKGSVLVINGRDGGGWGFENFSHLGSRRR